MRDSLCAHASGGTDRRGRACAVAALLAALLMSGALPPARAGSTAGTERVIVEPAAGAAPLAALIARARRSLDAEVAALSSPTILAAVEGAARRHVAVRLIVAARPAAAAGALRAAGVQVRLIDGRLGLDGGFLAADGARAWIGGMDWSAAGLGHRRGFAVIVDDTTTARQAETIFAADWLRRPLRAASGALVIGPAGTRAVLARLVAGARRTLDCVTAAPPDGAMARLLAAARRRGVRVRLATAVGSPRMPVAGTALVADGQAGFAGGQTLSAALDRRRAVGLLIRDRAGVAALARILAADLGGATTGAATTGPIGTATASATSTATATSPPPPTATATVTPAPPTATATVPPAPVGFMVVAAVSPNPVPNGGQAMLTAYSSPGATCSAVVTYGSGTSSVPGFQGPAQVVPATGAVFWQWTVSTSSTGGLATVTCTLQGATTLGRAAFIV